MLYIYSQFWGGLYMTARNQDNSDLLPMIDDQGMGDHVASLRYAEMIQHALMPDPVMLKGRVKDFFILFLPRDIVSGDFYYSFCNSHTLCIAAGDCTGHGVPGALMSILGISFLNEIMQSCTNLRPNRILNLMREKVMKALQQTGESSAAKDSIDIGLCVIDCLTGKLQYAGANRPLLMLRNGELTEYKADKMTIGIAPLKESPFTNNCIDTLPGDSFYLFTDGFSDQFGELSNKKLKPKQFKRMIESVVGLPMAEQKVRLQCAFDEWKGCAQQVDDVLVFGFQI
jgi:serine phosphatase RsbU (regulator of sigma subunit)